MALNKESFKLLKSRFQKKLDNMDQEWRGLWLDISNFIAPMHGRFLEKRDSQAAKGGDKTKNIINGTATRAIKIAAAGMKGGLTPHSLPWFKLSLRDKDLAKWEPARIWLLETQALMYNAFSRSNFYHAIHNVYSEELLFATGPIFIGEDPIKTIHCKPWTAGEYVVSVDEKGEVDAAFRWFFMSVSALAKKFGYERLSQNAKGLLQKNPDHHIQIIHAIFKRSDRDHQMLDNLNFEWGSCYWEYKGNSETWLGESGYNSDPLMFPRWDLVSEDAYGSSCPGMEMIGDVKMLQKLERDKLQALHKVLDPPMLNPVKMLGRLSTLPGAQNNVSTADAAGVKPLYQINPDINSVRQEIRDVEQRIKEICYNDLFLMILESHTMTATEVAQRHEDKLAILGPVIERQNSELLSPIIDRVYDIMARQQLIPPPPEELIDMELDVEYVSLLAQAQKMVGTQSIEKQLGLVASVAELNPEIIDTIDFDEVSEQYADMNGTPPKIIRSREERKKIRDQRAQAQAAMAQQEQAAQLADTGQKLGKIRTDEPNVAANILGQMVQQ